MAVRVVQAGQDGAPAGVDHPRRRAAPGQRLGVAADVDQAIAGDGHRLGARGGVGDGVDDAVMDDEIGGSGHAVLLAPRGRTHPTRRSRAPPAAASAHSIAAGVRLTSLAAGTATVASNFARYAPVTPETPRTHAGIPRRSHVLRERNEPCAFASRERERPDERRRDTRTSRPAVERRRTLARHVSEVHRQTGRPERNDPLTSAHAYTALNAVLPLMQSDDAAPRPLRSRPAYLLP